MGAHPQKSVRVRFAPSPTGHWHVGGVRTTLFNWLFARKHGGAFILRVEDTDKERSKREYEIEIIEMLRWLGIDWDEGPDGAWVNGAWKETSRGEYGPYHQSERTALYKDCLEKLLRERHAYYCYCTKEELEGERQTFLSQGLPPKYGGHCRMLKSPPPGKSPQVIRFISPEADIEFKDLIRGKVKFDTGLFGDFVIAKDTATPLYNFAVVVDDHAMKITHVIRGEEHLSNTPKQLLMQKALGLEEPIYAHLPLILATDRSKLSKRYAETSLLEYREKGFLPQAMLNFLALLGWHPAGDREFFTLSELVKEFDLSRVQKAGAVFDEEKLLWLNREHLRTLSDDELTAQLLPFVAKKNEDFEAKKPLLKKLVAIEKNRMKTLDSAAAEIQFFFELPEYSQSLLLQGQKAVPGDVESILRAVLDSILKIPEANFTLEAISASLSALIGEKGKGAVLWPMRVALSGKEGSPGPFEIAAALGQKETIRRLSGALAKLKSS
ncbi:MAG: glutamate--tRNA ligase [Candidatus Liptonbacteria bacterium]|nr:glutamate--tRNA ligase [Candidatus Liptonbacteria bacterium]